MVRDSLGLNCDADVTLRTLFDRSKRLNAVLLFATIALVAMGVAFVKSACSVRSNVSLQSLYLDHLGFACFGLVLALVVAFWDYRQWIKLTPWAYAGLLGLLVLVLIPGVGTKIMGARRWLFGIQPSEPAKIVVVMMLAYMLGEHRERLQGITGLLKCGAVVLVPTVLILMEPDLGTSLVLMPTAFAMLLAAQVCPKLLLSGLVAFAGVLVVILTLIYLAGRPGVDPQTSARYISWTGLREHQVKRVEVFLNPDKDIYGSGYNARQAEIAVGSGGLWGKGYLNGAQNLLGYLPASVSVNDFIFPVLAEEAGFGGAVVLLSLYVIGLFLPMAFVGARCKDNVGKLLCIGMSVLIFCHIFVNIGMTVRLVPITGLPLPFISYGGTFMLTMLLAVGIVQSVAVHGRLRRHIF